MLELSRELAERGRLRRHVHVSTAYVAGRYRGRFLETDLDVGQGFRNTYEQSKFEAERALGEAADGLPLVIARPSIIVGDSRSGWTSAFNVIYWPMRAFSRGLMDEVAIDPDGVADIVPVDYVADGVLALLDDDERRAAPSRSSPGDSAPTNAELIELACRAVRPRAAADRRRRRPRGCADARALRALLRHRGEPRRRAARASCSARSGSRRRRCATTSRR